MLIEHFVVSRYRDLRAIAQKPQMINVDQRARARERAVPHSVRFHKLISFERWRQLPPKKTKKHRSKIEIFRTNQFIYRLGLKSSVTLLTVRHFCLWRNKTHHDTKIHAQQCNGSSVDRCMGWFDTESFILNGKSINKNDMGLSFSKHIDITSQIHRIRALIIINYVF